MSAEEIQTRKRKIVSSILNSNESDLLSKIEKLLLSDKTHSKKTLTGLEKDEIEISRSEINSGKSADWNDVKKRLASEL